MSFGSDDPELRALFAHEAAAQLDRLADGALAMERGESSPELIGQLFRDAHTLKSSSSLVGFDAINPVAHALEDLLGELRAGRRQPDALVAAAVLATSDAIRAMVPVLEAGGDPTGLGAPAHAAIARAMDKEAADAPVAGPAADAPLAEPAADAPVAEPAAEEEAPAAADSAPVAATAGPAGADRVQVGLDRLDRLVRASGEAVAAQLRLRHLLADAIAADPDAQAAAAALERSLGALQQQTVSTRMTSLGAIAAPLRRTVRDVARARGKEVAYLLEGDRVELDRAVLDGLREPLVHLVRNAVDHGIEPPDERVRAGKPREGTVTVRATRRGPEIRIEVRDDGAGLDLGALRAAAGRPDLDDDAAVDLVFAPGLSTAGAVTDVSGRGVGMDAVRAAVQALRGRVSVRSSHGRGTSVVLTVPLTLAVLPCLLVDAAGERYAVPTHATATIVEDPRGSEVALEGGTAVWVGEDVVPLGDLPAVLGLDGTTDGPAVVVEGADGSRHALRVAAVAGQRDVTLKELGGVLPRNPLIAGASIEPDGSVVLVLDPAALVARAAGGPVASRAPAAGTAGRPAVPAAEDEDARGAPGSGAELLVVDDALTVRELQRSILERAGYSVRVAVDGHDALAQLRSSRPDCVLSDVEMPHLDGFGLAEAIRADPALASLPIMLITSRSSEDDRRRGLEAGADAYLVKQEFDERKLLDAVRQLLGEGP